MALSLNQFSMEVVQGMLDENLNVNTLPCQVGSEQATALIPGQAVKIVDEAGGVPKVIAASADTDDVFGFVNYNEKDASFPALSKVEISFFRGNVMYMTSNAAIARNAQVMLVITGSKVATATSNKRIVGRALDKAADANELIRVIIDLPGGLAS